MSKKSPIFSLLCLAAVVATAVVGFRAAYQPATASDGDDKPGNAAKIKPFDIPKGDSSELFKFVEELVGAEKEFTSPEEEREYQLRSMATAIAVAEKILKEKELDDDTAERAAQLKTQGLINQAMMGVPKGAQRAIAAVGELKNDPREIVANFGKNNERIVKIICVAGLDDKERDGLMEEILAELKKRKFAQRVLNQAQMLGEAFEEAGDRERVIALYDQLTTGMKDSGIEALVEQAARLEGQLRRLKLPGNFLEVEGTLLSGEPIDWKSYRGKVVLVDYWATWCGPCRQELPNVKKNYKKYHDRGFEVVGISLDDDQEQLEEFLKEQKITWTTMFEQKESNRGWEHPMVARYGITGIPMAILVDKEGKVVSLSARGPELSELLEKLLGEKE